MKAKSPTDVSNKEKNKEKELAMNWGVIIGVETYIHLEHHFSKRHGR